jgi:hypothetical protein
MADITFVKHKNGQVLICNIHISYVVITVLLSGATVAITTVVYSESWVHHRRASFCIHGRVFHKISPP